MNLRDELHRIADGAPVDPIAMAGVRAKARAIRRRRVGGAVGGAVVGVAAIAAASVLLAPGSSDRTNPLPLTQSPSPVSTSAAPSPRTSTSGSDEPVRTVDVNLTSTPAELTTGASLTVPNWMNGQLMDAHGDAISVSSPVYDAVRDAATGDWFGMTFTQGQWTWTWWGVKGNKLGSWPAPSSRVAVTPDGKTWAVMVDNGGTPEIDLWHAGQHAATTISLTLPQGEPQNGAGVDGILPNGDVVFEGAPGDVQVAHADGSVSPLPGHHGTVAAVTPSGKMLAQAIHSTPRGTNCYDLVTEAGAASGGDCYGSDAGLSLSGDGQLMALASSTGPHGSVVASVVASPFSTESFAREGVQLVFPKGAEVDVADGAWVGDAFVAPVWLDGSWRLVWMSRDGYRVARSLVTQGGSGASPYLLGAGPLIAQNP